MTNIRISRYTFFLKSPLLTRFKGPLERMIIGRDIMQFIFYPYPDECSEPSQQALFR